MVAFILVAAAAVAGVHAPVQPAPPGPIEQAVIEHRCLGIHVPTAIAGDPYHDCLAAQLARLRADFGPDLGTLTAAERRKLDAVCSRIRVVEGRERYVACLSDRLAALRAARADAQPVSLVPAAPQRPAVDSFPPASSSSGRTRGRGLIALGIVVALAGGAGGGALFLAKRRSRTSRCHACGATFDHAGDLCPGCRHEAAEERRRAAAERDDRTQT